MSNYEIESLKNKIDRLESQIKHSLEYSADKIIREQKNTFPDSFIILFTLWIQFIFIVITTIGNKH